MRVRVHVCVHMHIPSALGQLSFSLYVESYQYQIHCALEVNHFLKLRGKKLGLIEQKFVLNGFFFFLLGKKYNI